MPSFTLHSEHYGHSKSNRFACQYCHSHWPDAATPIDQTFQKRRAFDALPFTLNTIVIHWLWQSLTRW